MGRPSKRKLRDTREEAQLELLEKEGGEAEEERRSSAAGRKSEQPGEYPYRGPNPSAGYHGLLDRKVSDWRRVAAGGRLALSKDVLAQRWPRSGRRGYLSHLAVGGSFRASKFSPYCCGSFAVKGRVPTDL